MLRFRLHHWYATNIRMIERSINLALLLIILICYALLLMIFISPGIFNNDGFIYSPPPNRGAQLSSPIAVVLLSIVICGATVALVTRCVEESLWINLTPASMPGRKRTPSITIGESRNLAQWSKSTGGRLRYLAHGKSFLLRVSGICLLLCSIIAPVLLSGIKTTVETIANSVAYFPRGDALSGVILNSTSRPDYFGLGKDWSGFYGQYDGIHVNPFSETYRWELVRDNLGELAFQSSLAGLPAPVRKGLCTGWDIKNLTFLQDHGNFAGDLETFGQDPGSCIAKARIAGFKAECKGTSRKGPQEVVQAENDWRRAKFCSAHKGDVEVCVEIDAPLNKRAGADLDRNVFANFTNSRTARLPDTFDPSEIPSNGDYTIILGAYRVVTDEYPDQDTDLAAYDYNIVDCKVSYGWINITQTGEESVKLSPETFKTVPTSELSFPHRLSKLYGQNPWELSSPKDFLASPWVFYNTYDHGNDYWYYPAPFINQFPVGARLLAETDPVKMAQNIERAWDTYNLFSWAGPSMTADITLTFDVQRARYHYNYLVMIVLIVPIIAIATGVPGRWHISNDASVAPGYDPVAIARTGPVEGMEGRATMDGSEGLKEEYQIIDKLKIVRYQDDQGRYRFIVMDSASGEELRAMGALRVAASGSNRNLLSTGANGEAEVSATTLLDPSAKMHH